MSDPRSEQRRQAISALRRIRAVESEPDAEGIRTVWHQGVRGAELVSWVNVQGRVVRQDFSLSEDHFSWSSQSGLRTGEVSGEGGSKAGPASGMVKLDPGLFGERILRVAQAFEIYDGDDRYLLHFKRTLELTARGLEDTGEQTVTHSFKERPVEAPSQKRPVMALVIAGALLVAGLGVWLFAR